MKKDILIGGAWPYANYLLHIGHLAALLPGDVIARFFRQHGDNVIYVSGTDSHGTPITLRAKKEGKEPSEIAEYYHEEFVKSFNSMDFSYDMYTATFNPEHKKLVQEYFKDIYNNGYLYEKEEEQDYCPTCNKFLSDREIEGICPVCSKECTGEQCDSCLSTFSPSEVKDKHCKECKTKTILKNNKHLYFKLSAFQDLVEKLVEDSKDRWRLHAITETKNFINLGLNDRAATRQLTWGIEVPIKGFEDKRIYVWFEAVLGYITTCKRVCDERGIDFEKFMSNDNENLISYYVHGKDNIPFHTMIFPSLIKAIGHNWQLPKYIISSEYVNMNEEKMSKSKGNLITVNELYERYGTDTVRYYMIANGPEKKDISFSFEDIEQVHNKFLVGVLGNFINRNLSFIKKKFDGVITEGVIDPEIRKQTKDLYEKTATLIEKGELKTAIEEIMSYVSLGNKYYDENEPWIKVKEDIESFNNITYTCVYMMENIANLINPFMPGTSNKIKNILSFESNSWEEVVPTGDIKIDNLELLFQRIENK